MWSSLGAGAGVSTLFSSCPAPAAGPAGSGTGQAGDHGRAQQHRWGELNCLAGGRDSSLPGGLGPAVMGEIFTLNTPMFLIF